MYTKQLDKCRNSPTSKYYRREKLKKNRASRILNETYPKSSQHK